MELLVTSAKLLSEKKRASFHLALEWTRATPGFGKFTRSRVSSPGVLLNPDFAPCELF